MGLALDILILIALLAWAAWALVRLRRRRGCPYAGSCKTQRGDDSHD